MKLVAALFATAALVVGGALAACANGTDVPDDSQDNSQDDGSAADQGGAFPDAGSTSAYGGEAGTHDDAGQDARPACVPTDAGCTTGSPGACGAGVMDCDDAGAPYCRPLATTQACYSGPAATRGKGVCKDGLQTCTGTLGACTGEVGPTAHENCFNADDDDCDGALNNGCPDHLTVGAATPLTPHGGGGGGPKSVLCPPNAFVTRTQMFFDTATEHASGVAIFCAAPTLMQNASSYSVTLTQVAPTPYIKAVGNNPSTMFGDYDCGITGLVAGTWFVGRADGWVEGQGMHCGNGTLTQNADNTLSFSFAETGDPQDYYTYQVGTYFRDDCPAGEVLVGFNVRQGDWMDQIQSVCAPLVTIYK